MTKRFQQQDRTDCGAACLAFVCEHYGLRLPMAGLRQQLGTNGTGTPASSLVEIARKLGFAAKGVKGPVEALPTVPVPAIAHCVVESQLGHYVVLVRWARAHARVMDPATGRVHRWTHARFAAQWSGVLVLLAPDQAFEAGDRGIAAWRRWWQLVRPHGATLAQALVGAATTTVLSLAMSVYVQKLVDQVIPDDNRPLLNLLGAAMVVVLLSRTLLTWCQSLLLLGTAQRIDAALILGYYRHLLRLPQTFFDTMRIGEITSRISDAVKVREFLNQGLLALLLHPSIIVCSLALMFCWSSRLALLSLALVPACLAIQAVAAYVQRRRQRKVMEAAADFDTQLVESLQAQSVIRRFRLENHAGLRFELRLVRLLRAGWQAAKAGLGAQLSVTLLTQAYLIILLWLGSALVLEAGLTPGELLSCYTLAGHLTASLTALIGLNASIQDALVATDRLFELLDLELEKDHGTIEFTPRHAGDLRFDMVSVRSPGRSAALSECTLCLPARKITVLTGDSGSGKSTLLSLVQRLQLPESGRVLIGDHDVSYFSLPSLRRHLGAVPQHTHLLAGTVMENVAPGEVAPDMERMLGVCRAAGAIEFIERLPQRFLTPLTENGANLSGGQRQRLAIARALYFDAPILLLDEPSSALDALAERQLVQLMRMLREQGKTIVVAAHTSAWREAADRVVTLAGGRVVSVEDRV